MSEVHKALLALQSEVGTLTKSADNPFFKSKYVPLDVVVKEIQPLLTKHGLTWIAAPRVHEGQPTLAYQITHAESGETIGGEMLLMLSKNDPQGQGSAITYARRYALCAVLNLVADEDDDGNKASRSTNKQVPQATEQATFAEQVRGKIKGADVRKWAADSGFKLDDVGTSPESLRDFLNGLNAANQKKLLAWASA